MTFPRPSLSNFVKTLLDNGNTPDSLNIERLAKFNTWTSADEIRAEFYLQQNGSRKLAEEIAASCRPSVSVEENEE